MQKARDFPITQHNGDVLHDNTVKVYHQRQQYVLSVCLIPLVVEVNTIIIISIIIVIIIF